MVIPPPDRFKHHRSQDRLTYCAAFSSLGVGVVAAALARCPATDATSHGRRSFLVVIAASRRSRQRPSPLRRGGHGGSLCSFVVVVTAEVFFTPTQKQRKKRFTCGFRLFTTGTCLGVAPLRGTCAARRNFRRNRRKKTKTSRKKPPPLAVGGGHVAVFAAPPWRSRWSFADTAGGFSWRSFLVFQVGG